MANGSYIGLYREPEQLSSGDTTTAQTPAAPSKRPSLEELARQGIYPHDPRACDEPRKRRSSDR